MTAYRRLSGLVLVLASAPALAQQSPYYLGSSLSLNHVSNVYRLPEAEVPNSDQVASLALLAGIDKAFGRQRVRLDANLRHNAYRRDKGLNNNSYGLSAALDWQAFSKLSGSVSLRSNRQLAEYNVSTQVEVIRQKNIEQTDQAQLSLRYGLAGKLALEGGLGHQRREFSAPQYRLLNYQQDSASAGLVWRPSGDLRLGLTARHTEGEGFSRVFIFTVRNDYRRQDLELGGGWTASAASHLSGRLSLSRIDNTTSAVRDYSGVTGRLSWIWEPGAKLRFTTTVARDTVQENYASGAAGGSSEVNRVANSLNLAANYALTAKIALDAGLQLRHLDRQGAGESDDRSHGINLGLRWQPSRATTLGCQVNSDRRSSDLATLNYSASSYGCYAQIMTR